MKWGVQLEYEAPFAYVADGTFNLSYSMAFELGR